MTGSIAGAALKRRALGECACAADAEDTDEIRAEIGRKEVAPCRIGEDGVWVRPILSRWNRAWV
ncbi:hypothetical protein ColLi_10083 [Colletotrichum liriopes]|uniref:Uncharacterized protein n=1 Tax=Colletotrichum liriopes TaxID=708192 RepID=A0AA37GU26_9PEZI|nr:hypothetical protein ColLi_10083 [Colletotrichum liriopes]